MNEELLEPDDYEEAPDAETAAQIAAATESLAARCNAAGLSFVVNPDGSDIWLARVNMKCGRNTRPLTIWSTGMAARLLSVPFERYVFLSDLEAICSYDDGTIEAGIRTDVGTITLSRRLFGVKPTDIDLATAKIAIPAKQDGLPHIEISFPTPVLKALSNQRLMRWSLKLSNCRVATHDGALSLLQKIAGSILFQVELAAGISMTLERERRRVGPPRRQKRTDTRLELQYPQTQFENAPLSLYWYGRSAAGMVFPP